MREKKELPRNAEGEKLYPICNWERNQHKLYNAFNIAVLVADESKKDADWEKTDRIEQLIEKFNECVIDGIAYMTWSEGQEVKVIIEDYDQFKKEEMNYELDHCDIPTEIGWEEYSEQEVF